MTVFVELGTRSVCALMLNSSFDEKASTSYPVLQAVAERKGWGSVEVANLFPVRRRNSKALAVTSVKRADVLDARRNIEAVLARATEVLLAWGVSRLPGEHARLHREQVEWVVSRAGFHEHESAWMMGGETRHPSRWGQYVALSVPRYLVHQQPRGLTGHGPSPYTRRGRSNVHGAGKNRWRSGFGGGAPDMTSTSKLDEDLADSVASSLRDRLNRRTADDPDFWSFSTREAARAITLSFSTPR